MAKREKDLQMAPEPEPRCSCGHEAEIHMVRVGWASWTKEGVLRGRCTRCPCGQYETPEELGAPGTVEEAAGWPG